MTSYARKPNTFDELLIGSTTDFDDISTFFGQSYDTNRFSLGGAGFLSPGSFAIVVNGPELPGGTQLVWGNTGGYFRAERRGDGLTVGITYSTEALSNDPNFSST